jgi:hypothetical protein
VNSENKDVRITGNRWSRFSTYLKTYAVVDRDADGKLIEKTKRIETIERIGSLEKYNPFTLEDNPAYDPNEPLGLDEFYKMRYWIVLHNGQYYEGDINDPIWAGERYEIMLFDARDFNAHFKSYYYAPLNQGTERDIASALDTQADFTLSTLWNRLTNDNGELSRAIYLGRVVAGDVVKLEVRLDEFRSLFNVNEPGKEFGEPARIHDINGRFWQKFNYTFDTGEPLPAGIPGNFTDQAWGGYNSIDLWIEKAANAHFYTVFFKHPGEDDARIAYVSSEAVAESDGFVTINRHTQQHTTDSQGNDVPGTPLGLIEAGNYLIKVRAHGVVHNVPVTTLSGSGTTYASVSDPSGFPLLSTRMSAEGSMNNINVMIEQADQAEYYFIDIEGPLNYGWGNGRVDTPAPPTTRKIGHMGMNRITIPNLDASAIGTVTELTADEKNLAVPGVYYVTVSPVNRILIDADGNPVPDTIIYPLGGDPATVLVDYNRYMDQRYDEHDRKYAPRLQFEQFNPKDVDLEVNFNEGSGWFRLKLANDDVAGDDKTIDCRYTTSFVASEGRVSIYFSAPTGPLSGGQNTSYDVFRGGAGEVDVYLRTVAKPEFRDSLWPKQSAVIDADASRRIYINSDINSLPDCDPLKYWITNDATDVTRIEDYASSERVYAGYNALLEANSQYRIPQNDFGLVSEGKKAFFFSPMKNLTYDISASLAEVDLTSMRAGFNHTDNPEYRAMGGEYMIKLSNLDTQYGDTFRISVARASSPTQVLFTDEVPITSSGPHTYDITPALVDFIPNEEYLVCVQAANTPRDGEGNYLSTIYSSKVYRTVKPGGVAMLMDLADPKVIQPGYWSFANPSQPLLDEYGGVFLADTNYLYDEPLDSGSYNLYDPGSIGMFAPGRYFRIVHNGKNVADPTGLNLTPVAINLSQVVTPYNIECYIDPARGTFVLPRPNYWSKVEDEANLTSPEIMEVPAIFSPNTCTFVTAAGKFGNALYCNSGTYHEIYPLGEVALNKGTMSFWWSLDTSHYFYIYIGNNMRLYITRAALYIQKNGSNVASISYSTIVYPVFAHFYLVWDLSGGLSSGKTVRAFINGVEVSTDQTWDPGVHYTQGYGRTYIDNMKIWDHVVSENPSWEYNNGSGREDALHPIYGPEAGYKPLLDNAHNGGVGYYGAP